MSFLSDNFSPRWVVMLCQCAAITFLISLCAHAADPVDRVISNPTVPTSPAVPTARDLPSVVDPSANVKTPTAPAPLKTIDAEKEMDERMRDLARRMAETQNAGKAQAPKTAPIYSPAASDLSEAAQLANTRAAQSNNQRLADPEDAKPLSARRSLSPAPGAAPAPESGSPMMTIMAALIVVIALILLLRTGLKKMLGGIGATTSSSVVQVLSRVAVAPRSHVLLLRVGNRVLVVSDSQAGMRTLSQIENPEEVADILTAVSSAKTASATAGFRQMLTSMGSSYESKSPTAEAGSDEDEFRIDRARDNVSGLLGKLRNLTGKGGAE